MGTIGTTRATSHIAIALAIALLSGCSSVGCRQGAQSCPAIGPANGETDNGTSCAVVVQNRHVCTYDGEGRFKGESIHPGSGVCICLGWGN
jgi:hypothetical protein